MIYAKLVNSGFKVAIIDKDLVIETIKTKKLFINIDNYIPQQLQQLIAIISERMPSAILDDSVKNLRDKGIVSPSSVWDTNKIQ